MTRTHSFGKQKREKFSAGYSELSVEQQVMKIDGNGSSAGEKRRREAINRNQ